MMHTRVVWARILVALMVAATAVALLGGVRWGWLLGALGIAITADLRDGLRWRAGGE
jgi:hypothetical protein